VSAEEEKVVTPAETLQEDEDAPKADDEDTGAEFAPCSAVGGSGLDGGGGRERAL